MSNKRTLALAPDRPTWITIRDFAEAKGLSEKTVRNYVAAGLINAERCGPRLIRIPSSELSRFGTPVGAL